MYLAERQRALAAEGAFSSEIADSVSFERIRALTAESALVADVLAERTRALAAESILAAEALAERTRALASQRAPCRPMS